MQGESCRLAGVGCVVVRVASCLYRGAFWRSIGRLGLFFYETDTPRRVYPQKYISESILKLVRIFHVREKTQNCYVLIDTTGHFSYLSSTFFQFFVNITARKKPWSSRSGHGLSCTHPLQHGRRRPTPHDGGEPLVGWPNLTDCR
jgi:hypothetical protein